MTMHDKNFDVEFDPTAGIENEMSYEDIAEAKIKARQKAREDEKKKRGFFSRRKNDDETTAKRGYMTERLPYYVSPSYIRHNGRVMAIVELFNRPGANRNLTYSDVIDIIPVDSLDNVEMHLMINDALIKGDEKKKLIRKNAKGGKEVIADAERNGPKEDAENKSTQAANASDAQDFDEYELILDAAEPVVVFRVNLFVIGPDEETVEEQIQILNTVLDQRHEGLRWDSLGGDQLHRFEGMFEPLEISRFAMTSTGSNYAGLNFSVNAGLNDVSGFPIGKDALSLATSTSFFDMSGTLHKQAVVSIPRSSHMKRFEREGTPGQPSAASVFTQYAANQAVMEGHRVHHIVLNDWNYLEPGLYYRKPNVPGMFEVYDVSKVTINPLEGFGEIEDVVSIFSRLTHKIVNIFHILNNLEMTADDRGIILSVVEQFYFSQSLWIDDAEKYPKRTRIVNIPDPTSYPTLGALINEFTTLSQVAIQGGRENKADRVETLESILRQAITSYRGILGRPTSIKKSDARQVYYDFSNIESTQLKQVQFLNLLEYIVWTASEGDIIVIHGMDQLWAPVLKMAYETISAAQNKGYRFLYAFDVVTNQTGLDIKRADMFDMQGPFYKDLDTGMDWSVIGRCLPDEVDAFEVALATSISGTIRHNMQAKAPCQALVHRSVGDVNSFVHLNVVI